MNLADDMKRYEHPVPRFYVLSALGGLLVVAFLLAERGLGNDALLVVLLGIVGLITRFRTIPILLLILVAGVLLMRGQGHDLYTFGIKILFPWSRLRAFRGEPQPNPVFDVVLALAMLVYFQGQFRLYALMHSALSSEGKVGEHRKPIRRDPGPNDSREGLPSLGPLTAIVVLAGFVWTVVQRIEPRGPVQPATWRALLLAWMLATLLIVATTLARILFWRSAAPEVHRLYLQETLWRETRGEQARIENWITAARLQGQKKKEKG